MRVSLVSNIEALVTYVGKATLFICQNEHFVVFTQVSAWSTKTIPLTCWNHWILRLVKEHSGQHWEPWGIRRTKDASLYAFANTRFLTLKNPPNLTVLELVASCIMPMSTKLLVTDYCHTDKLLMHDAVAAELRVICHMWQCQGSRPPDADLCIGLMLLRLYIDMNEVK